MGEKKKPGRFTLQFNLEDPQQRTVSELLERQGRHKAQFLTSAVLCYIQYPKAQEHSGEPATIDETALQRILLSFMEKHPQFAATLPSIPSGNRRTPTMVTATTQPDDDLMGEDAIKAISDTLAAFRQD